MRTTIERKENRIGIRISDDTKERIERESARRGIRVSEYLREIIEGEPVPKEPVLEVSENTSELRERIEELETENRSLKFMIDDPLREEVERMAEMTCGVQEFYRGVLEKIKNGEMDFNERGFGITDWDIEEATRNVRDQIDDLHRACEEKQEDRVKAMTRVLKVGLTKVRAEIWGIRN